MSRGIDTSIDTLGSKVVSTSSSNSRLISRGHSSVGVGNKGGDMEGSRVGIGSNSWGSSNNRGNSRSSIVSVGSDSWSGSDDRGSSSIGTVSGSKVVSTGSSNSRLISRGHSSVGVGNKAGNMDGG